MPVLRMSLGPKQGALEVASKFSRVLLEDERVRHRITSIVAFGSANKPSDFLKGLSDIDVLVMVDRRSRSLESQIRRLASSVDYSLSPVLLSRRKFVSMLKAGDPGALLMLEGTVFYDKGAFSRARKAGFRPTEQTVKTSIDHAFRALSISINDYFSGLDLCESINCAYHCARHALRALTVKEIGAMPVSDREVIRGASKYLKLQKLYREILRARRDFKTLVKGCHEAGTRIPTRALRDEIGKLLLKAERVAVDSSELCFGNRPPSMLELLNSAKRKFGSFKVVGVFWQGASWSLVAEHRGKIKQLSA
jgi:predicted nucleotidyltransferase